LYFCKKRPKNGGKYVFIWIALDRSTNKVVDFEIGDRTKRTYVKLALRLEKRFNINHLCTDDYAAYGYYRISKHHHTTKSETCLIEAKNSIIRNYLARFNRKTKRYSKAIRMIHVSLTLLFWKDMLDLNFYL
jgi:insertion element IS1 protein InsB